MYKYNFFFFSTDEQESPREIYVPLETIPESQSTSELVNGHQSSKCADILIYFIKSKLFYKTALKSLISFNRIFRLNYFDSI